MNCDLMDRVCQHRALEQNMPLVTDCSNIVQKQSEASALGGPPQAGEVKSLNLRLHARPRGGFENLFT